MFLRGGVYPKIALQIIQFKQPRLFDTLATESAYARLSEHINDLTVDRTNKGRDPNTSPDCLR